MQGQKALDSTSMIIRLCSHFKHDNMIVYTWVVLLLVRSVDCKIIRERLFLIRNLSGTYSIVPMLSSLRHWTPLILYLWLHHVHTYLIRMISIIPNNFYFHRTHSCVTIISWWDHTYHTYSCLPKLFYLVLSWERIWILNTYHDLVYEIIEHITLERFGNVVVNHIPYGSLDYRHFTVIKPISDKEIRNVNVLFSFADWGLPTIFQDNGTIDVLVKVIIPEIVPLCCN